MFIFSKIDFIIICPSNHTTKTFFHIFRFITVRKLKWKLKWDLYIIY